MPQPPILPQLIIEIKVYSKSNVCDNFKDHFAYNESNEDIGLSYIFIRLISTNKKTSQKVLLINPVSRKGPKKN